MGEDGDFEEDDESDGSSSSNSESSDEPRAKTVRSIIHEVGFALGFRKRE